MKIAALFLYSLGMCAGRQINEADSLIFTVINTGISVNERLHASLA